MPHFGRLPSFSKLLITDTHDVKENMYVDTSMYQPLTSVKANQWSVDSLDFYLTKLFQQPRHSLDVV
jgi:hypothetical protein